MQEQLPTLGELVSQSADLGIMSAMGAGITALTTAVGYLWKRVEKELDECKGDREKLWRALAELGYKDKEDSQ